MKLYELFKGTEYVGEFTLDEIISITGVHRSALLNSVAHGVLVNGLWDVSPAYDRTLNRNDDNSLLKQFEAVSKAKEVVMSKVKKIREDVATTLKTPREKWFRDENGNGRYSLMADAFDSTIISWRVWETIRKLTCVVCGKQYVRQLANVENADEIAEKFCQFVYDLKMGFKNQEDTKC
ncbi:MAG: hypothetical protein EGS62_06815 [Ruminococcus sp.]|nr:hypothetical protein [Ruminococcus sp.]